MGYQAKTPKLIPAVGDTGGDRSLYLLPLFFRP